MFYIYFNVGGHFDYSKLNVTLSKMDITLNYFWHGFIQIVGGRNDIIIVPRCYLNLNNNFNTTSFNSLLWMRVMYTIKD